MTIIAESLIKAVEHLNKTKEHDFQIESGYVIEYMSDEELEQGKESIEWSYEMTKKGNKTEFQFYC